MHIKQAQLGERPRDKSLTPVNLMQTLKHVDPRPHVGPIWPFFTVFWFQFGSALIKADRQKEQFVSRTLPTGSCG